jgi:hypothetical protein
MSASLRYDLSWNTGIKKEVTCLTNWVGVNVTSGTI